MYELGEHAFLEFPYDEQDELLDEDGLAVLGGGFGGGYGDDEGGDLVEDTAVMRLEHAEGALDDDGVDRGEACHEGGEEEDQQEPAAVVANVFTPEPQHHGPGGCLCLHRAGVITGAARREAAVSIHKAALMAIWRAFPVLRCSWPQEATPLRCSEKHAS